MFIAQQKRRENIAEYILYLWQLEDLIRALKFSPDAIFTTLVEPQAKDDTTRQQQLLMWYVELGNLLRQEGKTESGHLEHTLHLIGDLQSLHNRLIERPTDEGKRYRELFDRLSAELPRLRIILADDSMTDIELCFRALYAVILYRLKADATKESAISDVIELVSPVIGELSRIYRGVERGEIDLYAKEEE